MLKSFSENLKCNLNGQSIEYDPCYTDDANNKMESVQLEAARVVPGAKRELSIIHHTVALNG